MWQKMVKKITYGVLFYLKREKEIPRQGNGILQLSDRQTDSWLKNKIALWSCVSE